ncbi:MAG: hypothetical protein HRT88_23530 [Lentisphaeraceae bacterium]|nr:hypothetical protein [Lentisphaeraceae bacterium]
MSSIILESSKKLKQVKFFGLLLMDVPLEAKWLAVHEDGGLWAFRDKPEVDSYSGVCVSREPSINHSMVCVVDLNGLDWRHVLQEVK